MKIDSIGKLERATQDRIIVLFRNVLKYRLWNTG